MSGQTAVVPWVGTWSIATRASAVALSGKVRHLYPGRCARLKPVASGDFGFNQARLHHRPNEPERRPRIRPTVRSAAGRRAGPDIHGTPLANLPPGLRVLRGGSGSCRPHLGNAGFRGANNAVSDRPRLVPGSHTAGR